MKLSPTGNHIIVKPLVAEEVTQSGIFVPKSGNEKPEQGEVIAVGPGKLLDNGSRMQMEIAVGDKVMFKKYSPDDFEIDGAKVLILEQTDVIAIIS